MNMSPYPKPFNSAHVRAVTVKILLIVGAVVTGILFVAEALSLAFPFTDAQALDENPMGAAVTLLIGLIGILVLLIYVVTVVFYLMWLYRAHNNLHAFDPSCRTNYSAGWAVGSFFVPFVNLVVPYRAVKEVWQKSGPPDPLAEPAPPASFALWWTFWLLACFAGRLSMRLSFNENVAESTATQVSMLASALSIIAAFFASLVVDAINKKQEETSRKLKLVGFAGPPPPPANLAMPDVVTLR